ncbi:uncharacterized protein LOC143466252 [Clavelina lepadiformis]|uniref:uncharacterized protein LOC143466252 n=1 Tax=Clavelina lepadiformis TaxID=159417 RepID=UPI00404320FC
MKDTMNGVTDANNVRPPSRIRRDKSRSSSKLKWNEVSTVHDRPSVQNPSLKVQDYEPGYALRKIALLYEKNQNEEVASLIKNLSTATLNKVYPEFPIEMFIEGIPHTLCIINSLYSRVFTEDPNHFPSDKLSLGSLITQIVKLYARSMSSDMPKLKQWDIMEGQCKNLLKVAGYVDGVGILKMLRHRRRCLERALEGLGEHGLVEVETSAIGVEEINTELMPMSSALRVELDRMIANCKLSMQKLLQTTRSLSRRDSNCSSQSPTRKGAVFSFDSNKGERNSNTLERPSDCNHQRMMQYTSANIQERLYKNKAVLNVIEPTMNYAQLPHIVSVLQDRIECDKDLLLTFSQLRKEIITVPADAKLAPALNHYSKAFNAVINVLKEFVPDDPGTPETLSTSGFRSDTESSVSPTKSKASSQASRSHNGSFDEVANDRIHQNNVDASSDSASNHTLKPRNNAPSYEAVALLQRECDKLRHELHRAQKSIDRLRVREKELVERLSRQAQRSFDGGSGKFEDLSSGQARPSELARAFRNLYSDGRLQALDALDEVCRTDDDIKSKLLFSVMVLSFRSCTDTLDHVHHNLHNIMCASRMGGNAKHDAAVREVETAFSNYLKKTTQQYDTSKNVEDVFNQICDALYDKPRLTQSTALRSYVKECINLSWSIAVQRPPLFLEYDASTFDTQKHDRFHTSDRASDQIVSYLWPSLLEKQSAKCVAKGIVVTGV